MEEWVRLGTACYAGWGIWGNSSKKSEIKFNPKGQLQEKVQARRPEDRIRYKLEKESGPPHQRIFSIKVTIGDKEFGRGEGSSKKGAEEAAAMMAIEDFRSG